MTLPHRGNMLVEKRDTITIFCAIGAIHLRHAWRLILHGAVFFRHILVDTNIYRFDYAFINR
jgi:hypothetical protein